MYPVVVVVLYLPESCGVLMTGLAVDLIRGLDTAVCVWRSSIPAVPSPLNVINFDPGGLRS